jgi:hypothetical protein
MGMGALISLLVRLVIFNNSGYELNTNPPKYIIPQGMIEMDSEFAKKIGFISGRFLSCSYLWGEGNRIIIKTIECSDRRRGYLRELFKAIWDLGVEIAVRTPLSTMKEILVHYGFKKTLVQDPVFGRVELWVRSK